MSIFNWEQFVIPALFVGAVFWLLNAVVKKLKANASANERERNNARMSSSAGHAGYDKLHGQQNVDIEAVDDDSGFFSDRMRNAQMRHESKKIVEKRAAEYENTTDDGLDDWAQEEEAHQRVLAKREEEERKAEEARAWKAPNVAADDSSVAEWIDEHGKSVSRERPKDAVLAKLYDDVLEKVQIVEQESNDLDYVINKLETGVDFISSEFAEAVDKWKSGKADRKNRLTI